MSKKDIGQRRLEAIPVMVQQNNPGCALASTIVSQNLSKQGGLITFGVPTDQFHKILDGKSVAICFVMDLAEWDKIANEIE